METRANYLMVGAFVLVLAAGLVAFVLWLARYGFDADVARYDIEYTGSVTLLQEGAPVRYKGVRVGEVVDLRIHPENPELVLITVEVDASTPIREDTVATVEVEGFTGLRFVLLSGSSPDAAPLRLKPGKERPVIASEPSPLEQVIGTAPSVVENVNLLVAYANELLNAENRRRIAGTLANLEDFTGALAEQREEIGAMVGDAGAAMANVRNAAAALERLVVSLEQAQLAERVDSTLGSVEAMAQGIGRSVGTTAADARELIAELRTSAGNLTRASQEIEAMIEENREPIRDFTATGLPELIVLMTEIRELVGTVDRVLAEMQRDPARFFFGSQQQGYEPK